MRGVAGGVLLGVPIVYTQEVWSQGGSLRPVAILGLLAVVFAANVALSYYVGFARGRTHRPFEDALIGTGLSIALAAVLLAMLKRITLEMPLAQIIGIVAITSVPVSLGFAIGNSLAPAKGGDGGRTMTGSLGDMMAAASGTIFLTLNIAPTEEPIVLAGELGPVSLLLVIAASLALPYLIVFYAEFGGRMERHASDGATQGPVIETLLAYVVAFALCAGLLAVFGRIDHLDSANLAKVVVLAFPGSLGAALGRMIV